MPQQSTHLPGDVAPLPSPSKSGPTDQYFSSFSTSDSQFTSQSQHPHFSSLSQYQDQAQPQSYAPYGQPQDTSQLQQPEQASFPQQPQAVPQSQPGNAPNAERPLELRQSITAQHRHQHQIQPTHPDGSAPHPRVQMSGPHADSDSNMHLRDFSLLAEAAKRAQVAVVARDMEEVSL